VVRDKNDVYYLAGPMSGIPEFNRPLFNEVTRKWEEDGYTVYNPVTLFGGDTTLPKAAYLVAGIKLLWKSDCIILLPGWEFSEGARMEVIMALTYGLDFFGQDGDALEANHIGSVFDSHRSKIQVSYTYG